MTDPRREGPGRGPRTTSETSEEKEPDSANGRSRTAGTDRDFDEEWTVVWPQLADAALREIT